MNPQQRGPSTVIGGMDAMGRNVLLEVLDGFPYGIPGVDEFVTVDDVGIARCTKIERSAQTGEVEIVNLLLERTWHDFTPARTSISALRVICPTCHQSFSPPLSRSDIAQLEDRVAPTITCQCARCGADVDASPDNTWFMTSAGAWFQLWKGRLSDK
jgi:hypothetical protein